MVEAAADVGVDFPFPFNFLWDELILSGAPRLRFFNHPVMQPPSLAFHLSAALQGMAGDEFFSSSLGGFGFVMA